MSERVDCNCIVAWAEALERGEAGAYSPPVVGPEVPWQLDHFEAPCEICGENGYLEIEEVLLCYECHRVLFREEGI